MASVFASLYEGRTAARGLTRRLGLQVQYADPYQVFPTFCIMSTDDRKSEDRLDRYPLL
jgi:hypothetical protein